MKKPLLFLLFLSLFLTSCKKNIDNSPPSLQILSPSANSIHPVLNVIPIEVIVEDDKQLEYVLFDVIDDEGKIAVPQINKTGLARKEKLTVSLQIDNIHLESGDYYIRIAASDGINKHNEYIKIIIQEIPLQLERTFIFNQLNLSMDSLSTLGETYIINQLESSPIFTATNSFTQEILLGFNNPSRLVIIDYKNINELINIPIPQDQATNFYNHVTIDPENHHYYISTITGHILEIGSQGTTYQNFYIPQSLQANHLVISQDKIIVEEKNYNSTPNQIGVYYKNSGILVQNHYINFDLIFLARINENEIILIGNENEQGIIAKYLINENTIITLAENLNQMISSIQINSNQFAISSNSEISTIKINPSSISYLQSWPMSATNLKYNLVSNQIIGISSNNYFNITISTNQIVTLPLIEYNKIELLYNK